MEQVEVEVPQGFLLIDKPQGWTSFDVVNKVRGVLEAELRKTNDEFRTTKRRRLKVGHSGTLDPLATGLLILAVGKATKQLPELIKKDKIYEVDAIFGATSTTGDAEGEIIEQKEVKPPSKSAVEAVLSRFEGEISQIPPAFSAIKVDGQRAYKLAREGKDFKLEPRQVTIRSISDVIYDWPELSFTVDVSSGTYIRSLVEDIGKELGVGAYMSGLRRTSIGGFSISNALQITKFTSAADVKSMLLNTSDTE